MSLSYKHHQWGDLTQTQDSRVIAKKLGNFPMIKGKSYSGVQRGSAIPYTGQMTVFGNILTVKTQLYATRQIQSYVKCKLIICSFKLTQVTSVKCKLITSAHLN